jgi:hypothetical protein
MKLAFPAALIAAFTAGAPLVDVATGDVNGDGTDDIVLESAQQIVIRDGKTHASAPAASTWAT